MSMFNFSVLLSNLEYTPDLCYDNPDNKLGFRRKGEFTYAYRKGI